MSKEKKPRSENEHKYNKLGSIIWMLKKLWGVDRSFVVFIFITIPVAVAGPLLQSYFVKVLLDRIGAGDTFSNLVILCSAFMMATFLLGVLQRFVESRCYARLYYPTTVFQNQLIRIYNYETDYENLEKEDYKEIMGYVFNDACAGNCSLEFTWKEIKDTLQSLLGIFTYGSLLGFMNPVLFAVIAVIVAGSYAIGRWQPAYTEKNKKEWEKEDRKLDYLKNLSNDFQMAKDIKLYALESWLNQMMEDFHAYRLMWEKRCNLRGTLAEILAGAMTLLQDGTSYIVLIGLLFTGSISVGDFVFYFGLVTGTANYLRNIVENLAKLSDRADKIGHYRDYYSYPNTFNHGEGCPLPEGAVEIELKNVWYKYTGADDYTLKGINLKLAAGESVALVGINGAGKTTLVKLISGMYTPKKGEILVNGKKISEYNNEEYYSMISAVFQEIQLIAFTIFEFVAGVDLERKTARGDAERALKQAGLWEKIESLPNGMDTHLMKSIYDDGVDLSGGETQKLLLARAIYKDGSILILDEPTAALDPIAENNLYLQYRELTKGKTSIYISHRFASTRFCDRIVLLENGRITESGTHEELMKQNGQYAYMFGVQSKYYQEEVSSSIDEKEYAAEEGESNE